MKIQQKDAARSAKTIRETTTAYIAIPDNPLFTEAELDWLQSIPTENEQLEIHNL